MYCDRILDLFGDGGEKAIEEVYNLEGRKGQNLDHITYRTEIT